MCCVGLITEKLYYITIYYVLQKETLTYLICVYFNLWFAAKLKFLVHDLPGSSGGISSQPNEAPSYNAQDVPMIPAPQKLYQIQKQHHLAEMVKFPPMYGFCMRWFIFRAI